MHEFFNWTNTLLVLKTNLIWLALSFALGAYIGYITCEPVNDNPRD
jgi:hypothetical protein